MGGFTVSLVATPTRDAAALVQELEDELSSLYLAEQCHGFAVAALFQPHIRFFVAYRGEQAVGCGGVALFADFAEVKRMYVRKVWRGQGAAEALMARLVEETEAAGLATLRLETGMHSHAAIAFYKRMGFAPCAIFEPYASLPPHSIATSVFLERRVQP